MGLLSHMNFLKGTLPHLVAALGFFNIYKIEYNHEFF